MKYTLTITEEHVRLLREVLIHPDQNERPAILLCGRALIVNDIWNGGPEERFLSRAVIAIPAEEIKSNSPTRVSWETGTLRRAIKKAEEDDLAVCFVHNHPNGALQFSDIDDANEPHLIRGIYNRNGGERPHASIVITPDGQIFGRAWSKQIRSYPLDLIRVLGSRFTFQYQEKNSTINREVFQRQQLAFGNALNNDLSKLKIAVVGAGATGTATAMLLSKIGVGQLLDIPGKVTPLFRLIVTPHFQLPFSA